MYLNVIDIHKRLRPKRKGEEKKRKSISVCLSVDAVEWDVGGTSFPRRAAVLGHLGSPSL